MQFLVQNEQHLKTELIPLNTKFFASSFFHTTAVQFDSLYQTKYKNILQTREGKWDNLFLFFRD